MFEEHENRDFRGQRVTVKAGWTREPLGRKAEWFIVTLALFHTVSYSQHLVLVTFAEGLAIPTFFALPFLGNQGKVRNGSAPAATVLCSPCTTPISGEALRAFRL